LPHRFARLCARLLSGHADVVEAPIVEIEQGFARLQTLQRAVNFREDSEPGRNSLGLGRRNAKVTA
jgi:hypothetical protein